MRLASRSLPRAADAHSLRFAGIHAGSGSGRRHGRSCRLPEPAGDRRSEGSGWACRGPVSLLRQRALRDAGRSDGTMVAGCAMGSTKPSTRARSAPHQWMRGRSAGRGRSSTSPTRPSADAVGRQPMVARRGADEDIAAPFGPDNSTRNHASGRPRAPGGRVRVSKSGLSLVPAYHATHKPRGACPTAMVGVAVAGAVVGWCRRPALGRDAAVERMARCLVPRARQRSASMTWSGSGNSLSLGGPTASVSLRAATRRRA